MPPSQRRRPSTYISSFTYFSSSSDSISFIDTLFDRNICSFALIWRVCCCLTMLVACMVSQGVGAPIVSESIVELFVLPFIFLTLFTTLLLLDRSHNKRPLQELQQGIGERGKGRRATPGAERRTSATTTTTSPRDGAAMDGYYGSFQAERPYSITTNTS